MRTLFIIAKLLFKKMFGAFCIQIVAEFDWEMDELEVINNQ
jgi:hypothetical protein